MADTRAIGQAIAQLRRAMHMTQQALAAHLYVSHQAVSKWENGTADPSTSNLLALSKLYGTGSYFAIQGTIQQFN